MHADGLTKCLPDDVESYPRIITDSQFYAENQLTVIADNDEMKESNVKSD